MLTGTYPVPREVSQRLLRALPPALVLSARSSTEQRRVARLDDGVDQVEPLVEVHERALGGVDREPLQVGPAVAEGLRSACAAQRRA